MEIADRLFTDAFGAKADRIASKFKQPDGSEKEGGGWCYEAAVDQIEAKLQENLFWSLSL